MLGCDIVHVDVGDPASPGLQRHFSIYKKLLIPNALFFKEPHALNNEIEILSLPTVDPCDFKVFYNWLNGLDIPDSSTHTTSMYIRLYLFAAEHCCENFQNAIMDAFQSHLSESNGKLLRLDIRIIFQTIPNRNILSTQLKIFCAELLIYGYVNGGLYTRATLVSYFKSSPELLLFYLDRQKNLGEDGKYSDPRNQGEGDYTNCYFHEHAEAISKDQCSTKPSES